MSVSALCVWGRGVCVCVIGCVDGWVWVCMCVLLKAVHVCVHVCS